MFNPATRSVNTGKSDEPRVNQKITATQVRLIDENGQNVGVVVIREAMRRAENAGLDLVEIAANGNIPVCKIIDAGKYKYELQKRKSEAKKKQKVQETKEIKFTPNIGENDYAFKMRNAKKFLAEGNKVKFTIRFRGREMSYQDLGVEVLNRAAQDVADIAKTEGQPKLEGRNMSLMVSPTK
ncbi:MAG: translation initiation factor IF-3 [Alphaproteobacteria bacterium]|nr:translation initiation factor IF-3 [Alphaproteobacteria bacterium]